MRSLTFRDAVNTIKPKLEKDEKLRKHFSDIVMVLQLLYPDEDIKKAFQTKMSKEEVLEYAKRTVLAYLIDRGVSAEDIYRVEFLSNDKIYIRANGHFDLDESYSCLNVEVAIASKIRIFTGYNVDIVL